MCRLWLLLMSMASIQYKFLDDKEVKRQITERILRALPEWFGREDSNRMYISEVQDDLKPFIAAYDNHLAVGFISLKNYFSFTSDIFLMAVAKEYHRQKIGKELVERAKQYCRENNKKLLIVKTLGSSHPNPDYAKTRAFYKNQGFFEIEENHEMWGNIPCLILGYVIR